MQVEWDPAKAAANRLKHRVSFEEATSVFMDPQAVVFDDPDHSFDEERFLIVGYSTQQRVLVVTHTHRGERIRIISARGATPRERKSHEEGRRK